MVSLMERPRHRDATDGDLIERHRAGDRDAFDELYHRYQPRLVAFCAERTRDRSYAEDLAHETLIRALNYLHSYDTSRPLWPWLRTTAARVAVNSRPRVTAEPWPSNDLAAEERPPSALVLDGQMNTVELRMVIDRAIRQLPPRQRAALRLLYANGCSAAEAGRHMGLRRPAFQQLVLRARRNLKTQLIEFNGVRLGLALPAVLVVRLRVARDRIRTRVAEVNPAAGAFPFISEVGIQAASAVGAVAMAIALTVAGTAQGDTSVAMQASHPLEAATATINITSEAYPYESRLRSATGDGRAADAMTEDEVNPTTRVATVKAPLGSAIGRDDTAETTLTEDDGYIIVERYLLTRIIQDDAPELPEAVAHRSETTLYCDGPGAATACDILWTAADLRDDVAG